MHRFAWKPPLRYGILFNRKCKLTHTNKVNQAHLNKLIGQTALFSGWQSFYNSFVGLTSTANLHTGNIFTGQSTCQPARHWTMEENHSHMENVKTLNALTERTSCQGWTQFAGAVNCNIPVLPHQSNLRDWYMEGCVSMQESTNRDQSCTLLIAGIFHFMMLTACSNR